MTSFHRTKRESRVLGFFALGFILALSMIFMLVGFHKDDERGIEPMGIIFGVIGVAVFVMFIRGAWMHTGGATIHVLSVDEQEIVWGFIGREQRLPMSAVRTIYWDETDGFNFVITQTNGPRIRLPYIEVVVPPKSREKFRHYLQSTFPHIPITDSRAPAGETAASS